MLHSKKILFSTLFLVSISLSAFAAEWVSFGRSMERKNPTARILVSNDQETIIEYIVEGLEVKDIISKKQ